jgi:hypothetical protein
MYWNDHLPPHYHAKYGEYEIINDLYQSELITNWELCRQQEELKSIFPLE